MRYKNWTLPYAFSFLLVLFGKKGYFRKISKSGTKNIPKGKPVIFAINHQNSLVDPCVVATTTLTPTYFLARSDVFKNPFVSKLLHAINMLPIYRKRDGDNYKEKNIEIFEKCTNILSKNGRAMIFPEGSHDVNNRLRVLKKGIARIAIQANLQSKKDVFIVPIGLNYSNKVNKTATLYINYGMPINATAIIEDKGKEADENQLISPIMEKLKIEMEKLMLHFEMEEFYDLYNFLLFDIEKIKSRFGNDLKYDFDFRKVKTKKITEWIPRNIENANDYISDINYIKSKSVELGIKPYLLSKKYSLIEFSFITALNINILILCLPIFLYGWLNNYLPYIIPNKLINSKIKDTQFYPAINMVVGTFMFVFFWAIQCFLVSIFTNNYYWFWYFLSLPISGWISFEYYINYRRFIGKLKYNSLFKSNPNLMRELRKKYLGLKQLKNNL